MNHSILFCFWLMGFGAFSLHAQDREIHSEQPASTLTYTLIHPMHVIHGTSNQVTCQVRLTEDTVSSLVACSAPLNSFDSRNENRDSHMLEVVEGLKYPQVQFSGKPVKHQGSLWTVVGTITFHGVTKPIEFAVTSSVEADLVRVRGDFPISLTDFHVERPSLLFVKTQDTVRVALDIVGKR